MENNKPKLYQSKKNFEYHWIPVRGGYIFDDGDEGIMTFMYDGEGVIIKMMSDYAEIHQYYFSFLIHKLRDFSDQIEAFENELESSDYDEKYDDVTVNDKCQIYYFEDDDEHQG